MVHEKVYWTKDKLGKKLFKPQPKKASVYQGRTFNK